MSGNPLLYTPGMYKHWLTFRVEGKPQTRGSKRPFPNRRTGKTILVDMNPRSKGWMNHVRKTLDGVRPSDGLFAGPVQVRAMYTLVRPKSHLTARGELRKDAPLFPTKKNTGDVDKLCRAVLDAMTGSAYVDDSQVCQLVAIKEYGAVASAVIEVWRYQETDDG